jgi:hypothetical protein
MIAYLDTTVFDHIYNKTGCTGADIAALRKAIYGREVSIPLGIHVLDEILLNQRASPQDLVARIKLTLSIATLRRLVKPCDQLLSDDIRAYAARGEAERPFADAGVLNVLSEGISTLIETDGEEIDEDMRELLEQIRRQKERFISGTRSSLEESPSLTGASLEPPAFEQFFQSQIPSGAEDFASRAAFLEQCTERGIDGLSHLKSLRVLLGFKLSYIYGRAFENLAPLRSDSAFHHVVAAAAVADTFVCDDKELRALLSRVPMEGFEVTDLPGFLGRVR